MGLLKILHLILDIWCCQDIQYPISGGGTAIGIVGNSFGNQHETDTVSERYDDV